MKIVVIGGTGLVGSRLVSLLRDRERDAVGAAPSSGVNTITGEGVAEALADAAAVIDVSNSPSYEADTAMDFFRASTTNLLAAEHAAGVRHHVVLSVVGVDGLVDGAYFRAKDMQERLIVESGVPYSIVRATQFFEFLRQIADAAVDGDVVRVAPVLIQPTAADDVTAEVARVVTDAPRNGVVEVAGPEQFRLDQLLERVLVAGSDSRRVIRDERARYFGAPLGERSLLPRTDAVLGTTRFADWLRQNTQVL